MISKLQTIEKIINSELSSKIQNSSIDNEELLVEIDENDLYDIVQFLKSNESCKFKQLIDIAGVDYPENEKRFELIYLFLSHENNLRIKVLIKFQIDQSQKYFLLLIGWREKFLICMVLNLSITLT